MCNSHTVAAITNLFRLSTADQLEWWRIRTANLYARTLESFTATANIFDDTEQILLDISATAILADKQACALADITSEQQVAFSDRLDLILADALSAIRTTLASVDDPTSILFQRTVAKHLGLI